MARDGNTFAKRQARKPEKRQKAAEKRNSPSEEKRAWIMGTESPKIGDRTESQEEMGK